MAGVVQTLILICPMAAYPPTTNCTIDNARMVVIGPEEYVCGGIMSQGYLAQTSLRWKKNEEYLYITCPRNKREEELLKRLNQN